MCQNSDNFDLFMITKVSSTYLFHKRGGYAKVSRARVSMFSMTKFATIDETGSPLLFQNLFVVFSTKRKVGRFFLNCRGCSFKKNYSPCLLRRNPPQSLESRSSFSAAMDKLHCLCQSFFVALSAAFRSARKDSFPVNLVFLVRQRKKGFLLVAFSTMQDVLCFRWLLSVRHILRLVTTRPTTSF